MRMEKDFESPAARAVAAIIGMIEQGRLPHCVLIECEEEKGAELALTAAQALVCSNAEKPCGKCAACIKAQSGSHPDILTYYGATGAKGIKVDHVRDIISKAYIIPNEAEVKVFVILGADTMSEAAQNALLKIIEEPPQFTRFILVCGAASQMLPTVLSRCAVFRALSGEKKWDEKAVAAAEGLARAVVCANEFDIVREAAVFEKDKELLRQSVEYLQLIYRDAAALRASGEKLLSSSRETAQCLASSLTLKAIDASMQLISKLRESLGRNANQNLIISIVCSELRTAAGR